LIKLPRKTRQELEDKIRFRWSDEWEELLDERAPRVYMPERLLKDLWNRRLKNEGTLLEIYFKHIEPFEPDPVKFLRGLLFRVDKYIKKQGLLNTTRSSFMSEVIHYYLLNKGIGSEEATRKGLNLQRKKRDE